MSTLRFTLALLAGLLLLSSCKKDDNPTSPPGGGGSTTKTYAGTFAGVSETGSMTMIVTIPGSTAFEKTATIDSVSGTITINGGATITLKGTFNSSNDSLIVSGGGYTFRGKLSGTNITGTYSGPNGNGGFNLKSSTNNSVKVFCGTYISNAGNSNGRFNLAWDSSNASISVLAFSYSDPSSQNQLSGITVADSIKVFAPGYTNVFIALGKFTDSADTAAVGVYNDYSSDYGTWSFFRCR